jgi:hypothetical protein
VAVHHAAGPKERTQDVLEFIQEKTGIYSLGFEKESFLGLMIPILFVLVIGGLGAALIFFL